MTFSVSSCCDPAEEVGITTPPPAQDDSQTPALSSTTNVPDGYNFGIVSQDNGNTYLVSNNNGDTSRPIDRIFFELTDNGSSLGNNGGSGTSNKSNGTAIFSDTRVRSITINGVTYTFHENENQKIDVAITSNGISELFTDVAPSQLLGNANYNGGSFSANMSDAFSKIYSGADIITASNALVSPNSALYQYIQGVIIYLNGLKDDTGKMKEPSVTGTLVTTPTDTPTGVTPEDVEQTDTEANENTNTGNGAIVSGKGALKVTLTWFFKADIDLHVYEPDFDSTIGHIWYGQKTNSFTDGFLDIDNVEGYYINPTTMERNTSLSAVENIYWPTSPKDGVYKIYLDYFSGIATGSCNLTIFKDGKSIYSQNVTMLQSDRQKPIVSVQMPEGTITTPTRGAEEFSIMDYRLFPAKN